MTQQEPFPFPQPGESRQDDYRVLVDQLELVVLLADAAVCYALVECPVGPDCEGCNLAYRIWWDLALSLSRPNRVAMQRHLSRLGIPVPPGPWEEVDLEPKPEA